MPRNCDNWLKTYLLYTKASESPTNFHFWTGVSTIAGALRRRVWIDQKYFQWTPNFYIILVGPAGIAAKSTSIRSGVKFLERLKTIRFGPQSMTWQALALALQEAIETIKYIDPYTGMEVKHPMSCLTITVGELGTFLKPDDSALVDALVSLWDGQLETWSHQTKSSGNIEIKNPWLNIIACTTPSWLQAHFPEHMIGGGLTSRIIFVFGDKKRHFVPYPAEIINDQEFKELEDKLFFDLAEISTMAGKIVLTPEALQWGSEWYEKHWSTRPVHMASERYGGYISRKQTHIHKLAIVLAASRHSKLIIEKQDLWEAEQLITSIEPDMQKAFASIGVADEAKRMQQLVSYTKAYGFIKLDDLYRLAMQQMSRKDFESTIAAAIQGRVLAAIVKNGVRGLIIPTSPSS